MLFSSLTFLHIFLPSVLVFYFLSSREARNYILLVASIIFYAWGEPLYLAMMLFTITANYAGAIAIESMRTPGGKKAALWLAVIVDLGFLFYFKYFNFFVSNLNRMEVFDIPFIEVIMPIGISFYTFQAMSYLIDVYRGEVRAQRDFYKLALYISLFPQLVAGPIVKYHDVYEEINSRRESFDRFVMGLKRFIIGLAKKVLLANTIGAVVDVIFALPVEELSASVAWMGIISYTLQLYFDFSGYSDMAIGLGHMFGFRFLENFNYPYVSKSVTEFWRRWHISLSTWFKQYLYIPLGGNRVSKPRQYLNLFIVFLATGFWHGASWSFVLWGVWNGIFIILEKLTNFTRETESRLVNALKHVYGYVIFTLGLVIFRADDLPYAWGYLRLMLGGLETSAENGIGYYADNFFIAAFLVGAPASIGLFKNILEWGNRTTLRTWIVNIYLIALYLLTFLCLAGSTYNPFIYFRF
ncbi:MAG: MBOAT family protein [Alphaproteobacteria bacterium]|jgi:alginate O-acetyltransferase complex protein AlgI